MVRPRLVILLRHLRWRCPSFFSFFFFVLILLVRRSQQIFFLLLIGRDLALHFCFRSSSSSSSSGAQLRVRADPIKPILQQLQRLPLPREIRLSLVAPVRALDLGQGALELEEEGAGVFDVLSEETNSSTSVRWFLSLYT